MPPTTKEGQRAELHKTIWRIANDLRGSVDGWAFKTYVLGLSRKDTVYDPACGSDSLLLKFANVMGKDEARQGYFSQEINLTTYNLGVSTSSCMILTKRSSTSTS